MRIIFKIAKNELRQLFYSPVAWFLAIVMLVLSAAFYTNIIYYSAKVMALIAKSEPFYKIQATESITNLFFENPGGGFFATLLRQLYLFVPLLTMGVINREFNNGTIKLLYSSPVRLTQIVLGKYLAMALYCLLLIAVAGIFILLAFADIKNLDFPPLLSGSLGLFLLLCALTAIGFFMSSLTSYQIVAAIASFTVLFVLSRIGGLWQQYDFVRDLTWFLAIDGRTEKMITGLITSKDIIYYLLIIFMFVSFTWLKMNDGMETRRWYIKTARYLSVIIIALSLGYLSSRPATTLYFDTTAQKLRTIHPNTQQILQQLNDGPLEVTLYTNLFHRGAGAGLPAARNQYLTEFWEQYQRFKPDIKFKYEYYYAVQKDDSSVYKTFPGKSLKQIAALKTKSFQIDSSLFKPVAALRSIGIDTLESEDYRLLMILRYKGRTAVLRTYIEEGMTWPTQQNMSAALNRLLIDPIPKVYYVSGELERSIYKRGEREFHALTIDKYKSASLINMGFDPDSLNLNSQDIPSSASMLVLADPKMDLSETVITKLRNYIQTGGNMLIMGEPGKQYVMNPLLQQMGVQLKNGQLVQPGDNETPDKVSCYITNNGLELADEISFILMKRAHSLGIFKDSLWASLAGVTGLSVADTNGFEAKPVLMTQPNRSWQKSGKLVTDSAAPVFTPLDGDTKEVSGITGVQLTRMINRKQQRIIITGDADMLSTLRAVPTLQHTFYSWLAQNKFPVYTTPSFAKDTYLTITPERAAVQRVIFIRVAPALVLIAAIIILIRRKRK